MKDKYANITQEFIMTYLKCCEFCQRKQSRVKKGIVIKPIESKEAFSRFQVDYIDMKSCPDVNEKGTFNLILYGKDHLTKFVF